MPKTSQELDRLASKEPAVKCLVGRYYISLGALHQECFLLGLCEPIVETERRILETYYYIRDAESLAYSDEAA